jgi:hypothetical protein
MDAETSSAWRGGWKLLRQLCGLIWVAAHTSALASTPPAEPLPYIYSNEEQVYFAKEAKLPAPPLVFLKVEKPAGASGLPVVTGVDAFGAPAEVDAGLLNDMAIMMRGGTVFRSGMLNMRSADARIEVRKARPATCWVAIRKDKPMADGSPDWFFAQGVKLHDQGGRALVGVDSPDTQSLVIRMRNVIWPAKTDGTPSTNKPSIVLYVHKPDQPDRSEAYAWADPGAARVGINLRWMQASCGIDGMEPPSAVPATSFQG